MLGEEIKDSYHSSRRRTLKTVAGVAAGGLLGASSRVAGRSQSAVPTPHKIGILADTHYNTQARAESAPSPRVMKEKLDIFVNDMNHGFEADLVVHLGDIVDGFYCDEDELIRRIKVFRQYLEEEAGRENRGLDANIVYLMGNHEYTFAGSGNMDRVYNAFGLNGLEDTWYMYRPKGVRLMFLNTSYTETDKADDPTDHRTPNHEDPANEHKWIRERSQETVDDGPLFTFMHAGLTGGDGSAYDLVQHRWPVRRWLSKYNDNYVAGFFGHSHHNQQWDWLKRQRDDQYNVPYIHTTAMNNLGNNRTWTVYTKLTVDSTGEWEAEANYPEWTGYPTRFSGGV